MALIESFEDLPGRGPQEPTIVWVTGEHDTSTVSDLSATLAQAIALVDEADVLLDLSGVGFMDVSTLRVVLRAQEFLNRRGRSLSVRSPAACARLVLNISGLAGLIEPERPVADAATRTESALASWVDVPMTDLPAQRAPDSVPAPP